MVDTATFSSIRGDAEGRREGYRKGWEEGLFLGRCERELSLSPIKPFSRRDIHVLYVAAGIDVPYPALDRSILDGFSGIVSKVTPVTPSNETANQAKRLKPDLVLVLNGVALPIDQVQRIKEMGIPIAVWLTDDPYYTDWTRGYAPHYDYVFTLESNCVAFYRALGCKNVEYLPFAANRLMYSPGRIPAAYRSDICFIGTAFWNRVALIDEMADFLVERRVVIVGWWWDRLRHYHRLADRIRLGEWLSPEETAKYYHGAKIVINLHREANDSTLNFNSDCIPAHSVNPRTFEINACGTLQMADERADLHQLYVPGSEIVTFRTADELIGLMRYFLTHEEERQAIALRGLSRTIGEHHYQDRLTVMLERIFDH